MFINEHPTLRAKVRIALYEIERERPGALLRLLDYFDYMLGEALHKLGDEGSTSKCSRCGAPTTRGRSLCKLCELLERIGVKEPTYARLRIAVRRGSQPP